MQEAERQASALLEKNRRYAYLLKGIDRSSVGVFSVTDSVGGSVEHTEQRVRSATKDRGSYSSIEHTTLSCRSGSVRMLQAKRKQRRHRNTGHAHHEEKGQEKKEKEHKREKNAHYKDTYANGLTVTLR